MNLPIKVIFCTNEQKESKHSIVHIGKEIIFSCLSCNSFIKFPDSLTKEQINTFIEAERKGNKGQVVAKDEVSDQTRAHELAD